MSTTKSIRPQTVRLETYQSKLISPSGDVSFLPVKRFRLGDHQRFQSLLYIISTIRKTRSQNLVTWVHTYLGQKMLGNLKIRIFHRQDRVMFLRRHLQEMECKTPSSCSPLHLIAFVHTTLPYVTLRFHYITLLTSAQIALHVVGVRQISLHCFAFVQITQITLDQISLGKIR